MSSQSSELTRRQFLQLSALLGASTALASCGGSGAKTSADTKALLESGEAIPMDQLIKLAQEEGTVTTIALPRDWANYGEIIDTFKTKYNMKVNELFPDAGSADELEAIRANKGNTGQQNPDTVDVGITYAVDGKKEGLWAKYKCSVWDSIPDNLKDAEGYWWAEYFGVLGIQYNATLVKNPPTKCEDLLKPEYKNMVSTGDPTKGNESVMGVWVCGIELNGGKVEGAAEKGIEFWAELNKAGNMVPTSPSAGTIAKGETPIVMRWDYLALADRDTLNGNPEIGFLIPEAIALGGPYASAVNATGPHPFAARLWTEWYMSDEGQLLYLKGYAHPARYNDMVKRGVVPTELSSKLPDAKYYENALFPTLDQIAAAKQYIAENWRTKVLGA
jgi:putative spermidine/putrescine transport system substrate-binding protein